MVLEINGLVCLVYMPSLFLSPFCFTQPLFEKQSGRESRERTTYGNRFTVYLNILGIYYILVFIHRNQSGTVVHCCL